MAAESWRVLLVESVREAGAALAGGFKSVRNPEFHVSHVRGLGEAVASIDRQAPDAVILNPKLPDAKGFEALEKIRGLLPKTPIIILADDKDDAMAVQAVQLGAEDFLRSETIELRRLVKAVTLAIARTRRPTQ